jgi:hypothetical protein
MADSFTYELAHWFACPTWWKQFVYTVDPDCIMHSHELEVRIHEQLDKWQIIRKGEFLIFEHEDHFCAFVLAYSD